MIQVFEQIILEVRQTEVASDHSSVFNLQFLFHTMNFFRQNSFLCVLCTIIKDKRKIESEHQLELIKVANFAKPVSECSHNLILDRDHTFVDLERVVDHCVSIIYDQLPRETTHTAYRVPPLALMRFARGGKTTTLAAVFDKIKYDGRIQPLLISFNGNGTTLFKRRDGETQSQLILRLIATQLVEYSPNEAHRLLVDREALDAHLGDNVVLLVDELNNLGVPLDSGAAELLREMFLDRAGRFLVFTSQFPVSIEANIVRTSGMVFTVPPNFRGVSTVDMSLAMDLSELRNMTQACEALTEEGAAWLGYIPSLILCAMDDTGVYGEVTPSARFKQLNIVVEPERKLQVLQRFVKELLSGQRDKFVAQYYGAFASVGADSLVSYPLCYVLEIFIQLSVIEAVVQLVAILRKLRSNLSCKHSGLAWECTVEMAIILRMLAAHWFCSQGPFDLVPAGTMPDLAFHTLPDECDTLEDAKHRMESIVKEYDAPTLMYVVSANNARYPEVEGFILYTSGISSNAKIVGFQMKTADVTPRHCMDRNIINGGAVLIRGRALAKSPREPKVGWRYMTSQQVRDFLGISLLLAMPREWLRGP